MTEDALVEGEQVKILLLRGSKSSNCNSGSKITTADLYQRIMRLADVENSHQKEKSMATLCSLFHVGRPPINPPSAWPSLVQAPPSSAAHMFFTKQPYPSPSMQPFMMEQPTSLYPSPHVLQHTALHDGAAHLLL
ncbi:hypothetical protein KSP39_PZI019225 [Platanthera zijinensis]|uniref:Uncharacterized protein n=1 Tax=Platanthera zijinensis TaxID=2320716 RepID=A0AAP0FXN9_9ASPA